MVEKENEMLKSKVVTKSGKAVTRPEEEIQVWPLNQVIFIQF